MTATTWHLAQVNIGRLREPIDHPEIAEFRAALDTINALAEASPGFVWRLQDEAGNATSIEVDPGDELVIPNMSVWESVESLSEFVYRTDHTLFLRRRREWFQRFGSTFMALWWVPAGHVPTLVEAQERLDLLERDGPGPDAFTFRHRFPPPVHDPGCQPAGTKLCVENSLGGGTTISPSTSSMSQSMKPWA